MTLCFLKFEYQFNYNTYIIVVFIKGFYTKVENIYLSDDKKNAYNVGVKLLVMTKQKSKIKTDYYLMASDKRNDNTHQRMII